MVLVLGACGEDVDPSGALLPEETTPPLVAQDAVDETYVPLDRRPEDYGLPPIETLRTHPGGVADALVARFPSETWATTWQLRTGEEAELGELAVEHLPALDTGEPERLHLAGVFGTPDTQVVAMEAVDSGAGPRICAQIGSDPLLCDLTEEQLEEIASVVEFLSLAGLGRMGADLRTSLQVPGLSVNYAKVGGEPSACFNWPASVTLGEALGVDLSEGGRFCLSRDGVPVLLEVGDYQLISISYTGLVDPQKFRLPVDS